MPISTQGPGLVPKPGNPKPKNVLKFSGEDVLGFCATNIGGGSEGASTSGLWEMVLDGSAQGVLRNNIDRISMNGVASMLCLTSKKTFDVGNTFGGLSTVFGFDMRTRSFSGPYLRFSDDLGIQPNADAFHITGELKMP